MPPESDDMRARRLRSNDDYDAYASDGNGPVPLEHWTVLTSVPRRLPVSAADLRRALDDRRAGRDQRSDWIPLADRHENVDREPDRQLQSAVTRRPPSNVGDGAGPSGVHATIAVPN